MIPWTAAHQAPLSMEFSRQNTGVGYHFPPPGDLPDQGSNLHLLCLLLAGRFFIQEAAVQGTLKSLLQHHNSKVAEQRRTDAFELWCWRRLLRVTWTARRSNQPILKEINPEYSLEGLLLTLKLQYFGHLIGEELIWPPLW